MAARIHVRFTWLRQRSHHALAERLPRSRPARETIRVPMSPSQLAPALDGRLDTIAGFRQAIRRLTPSGTQPVDFLPASGLTDHRPVPIFSTHSPARKPIARNAILAVRATLRTRLFSERTRSDCHPRAYSRAAGSIQRVWPPPVAARPRGPGNGGNSIVLINFANGVILQSAISDSRRRSAVLKVRSRWLEGRPIVTRMALHPYRRRSKDAVAIDLANHVSFSLANVRIAVLIDADRTRSRQHGLCCRSAVAARPCGLALRRFAAAGEGRDDSGAQVDSTYAPVGHVGDQQALVSVEKTIVGFAELGLAGGAPVPRKSFDARSGQRADDAGLAVDLADDGVEAVDNVRLLRASASPRRLVHRGPHGRAPSPCSLHRCRR